MTKNAEKKIEAPAAPSAPTARPAGLGLSVTLNILGKVDAALAELGWCEAEAARIDALCDEEVAAVQDKYAALKSLTIGAGETTLDERAELLRGLILEWAEQELANHLPAEGKTLVLEHGNISSTDAPPAVELYEGWTDKDVLIELDSELKFIDSIRKIESRKFGDYRVSDFVRLTPAVNKARLLQLIREEKIDNEVLGQFALGIREQSQNFAIKTY